MGFLGFFSATVANLQAKVEQLTTTNALMKEDLAIARNSLLTLQAENAALRQNAQQSHAPQIVDNANVLDRIDPEMAETLAEERKKRQELEKELELQVCWGSFLFMIFSFENSRIIFRFV